MVREYMIDQVIMQLDWKNKRQDTNDTYLHA